MSAMPRDATEAICSGFRIAWLLALGQVAALVAGSTLTLLFAGYIGLVLSRPGAWFVAGTLGVFPMAFFHPLTALLLIPIGGAVLVFWASPARRLDAWFTICLASNIIVAVAADLASSASGCVTGALMVAIIIGAWICLRKLPAWRYHRAVRKIERGVCEQ